MYNKMNYKRPKMLSGIVVMVIFLFVIFLSSTVSYAGEMNNDNVQNEVIILNDSVDPLLLNDHSEECNLEINPMGNGPKPKKYIYRSNLLRVAYAGEAAGLTTAANLLEHSLADAPADLSYASGTSMSNQIKNSTEYKSILKATKSALDNTTSSTYSKTSSTILNSTSDLKMAYNKVSYKVSATKKSGKWTINVVFSDTYDFDYISWKEYSGLGGTIVAIVNNYGATAQSVGAVVPYNIKVTVSSTYIN